MQRIFDILKRTQQPTVTATEDTKRRTRLAKETSNNGKRVHVDMMYEVEEVEEVVVVKGEEEAVEKVMTTKKKMVTMTMERSDSMMDISSSGSTDNMEDMCEEGEEVGDEDMGRTVTRTCCLLNGVFGIAKNARVIPQYVTDKCSDVLGEDSFFVHENAIGIFDGVGGWRSNGVDPAEYSGSLARECLVAAREEGQSDPAHILETAYETLAEEEEVVGSSTACVVCLEEEETEEGEMSLFLNAAYVGDSGYMIIRRDEEADECYIVFKSEEQQHYFNAPFQLALVHGRFAHMRDTIFNDKPDDAILKRHQVLPGDVIVAGTDGLLDNLFDQEILDIVQAMYNHHPMDIARAIVQETYNRSRSAQESPFSRNARLAGQYYRGGKQDDISTVVSRVVELEK